ncbi:MAG: hypothetical protein EGP77_07105 [Lachnospiraceae bacterium]|nr:hypothetical protein [Lachnospiraceae bacterium]HCI24674.1 hypothetical protein [Lachnospiraceae bacterium]
MYIYTVPRIIQLCDGLRTTERIV